MSELKTGLKIVQESEPIVLKEGVEADIPRFLELESRLASKTYSPEKSLVLGNNNCLYLIKVGGEKIGHILLDKREDGTAYLNTFSIDPAFQGRGLGTKAMAEFMSKIAKFKSVDLVTHPENTKAIKLYERFGFKIKETKQDYFGDGEPRVVMVLDQDNDEK